MSDTQHTTARPAHHTPICPANLGCPECPEAPAVPATPRSPRAGQGSGSLGSAQPGAEGTSGRGPPGSAQPRGGPTFPDRSPPARGRSPLAQTPRGGAAPGKPTCVSGADSPSSRGGQTARKQESRRTAARVRTPAQASMVPLLSGSGSGSSSGSDPAPEVSVRRRRDFKREAAVDATRDRTAGRAPAAGGPVAR